MIPAICALVSVVLIGIGALQVLRAQRALTPRIAMLEEKQTDIFDPARVERALERISTAVDALPPLIGRAQAALSTISKGLAAIRMAFKLVKSLG